MMPSVIARPEVPATGELPLAPEARDPLLLVKSCALGCGALGSRLLGSGLGGRGGFGRALIKVRRVAISLRRARRDFVRLCQRRRTQTQRRNQSNDPHPTSP